MLKEVKNPWKILDSKEVYASPWIQVTKHNVLNPSKHPGTYSVVHFKHIAIGILPLDENYNTWIVGQYRFPLKRFTWEIPEGGGDLNVPPIDSAIRELSEEVGIAAKKWTNIQEFETSNASTDERAIIFVAQNLSFHKSHPDENEQLEVKKLPFSELYELAIKGEITDSLSLVAILKTKLLIDKNLL
ncbi:MAG: ADP-ribose pyrophosphatase [Glaciecola sp.]|jgi:ADP-ribose pyrophosphatase